MIKEKVFATAISIFMGLIGALALKFASRKKTVRKANHYLFKLILELVMAVSSTSLLVYTSYTFINNGCYRDITEFFSLICISQEHKILLLHYMIHTTLVSIISVHTIRKFIEMILKKN